MPLFDVVKETCKERGITQAELEKRCGLGKGSISKWKNHAPTIGTLAKVAEELGVPVDYLYNSTYTSNNSDQTSEHPTYYDDPEVARIAQEMYDDPQIRGYFHMKKNMDPEKFQAHYDFMKSLYIKEHPEDDDGFDGC